MNEEFKPLIIPRTVNNPEPYKNDQGAQQYCASCGGEMQTHSDDYVECSECGMLVLIFDRRRNDLERMLVDNVHSWVKAAGQIYSIVEMNPIIFRRFKETTPYQFIRSVAQGEEMIHEKLMESVQCKKPL